MGRVINYGLLDTKLLVKAINNSKETSDQLFKHGDDFQETFKTTLTEPGQNINLKTSESMKRRIVELENAGEKMHSLADLFLVVMANFREVSK